MKVVVVLLSVIAVAFAATGIDMSMAACRMYCILVIFIFLIISFLADYGQNAWNCMKNSYGNSFAIIQGFDGGYGINTHSKSIFTILNNFIYFIFCDPVKDCTDYAWNAGFSHVDVVCIIT